MDSDMSHGNALPTDKCAKPATKIIIMQKLIQEDTHNYKVQQINKAEIDDEKLFIRSI